MGMTERETVIAENVTEGLTKGVDSKDRTHRMGRRATSRG